MTTRIEPNDLVDRSIDRARGNRPYPVCPFCQETMQWRWSVVKSGSINKDLIDHIEGNGSMVETKPARGSFPTHDDQTWKCPNCYFVCTFGIPITKAEYDKEIIDRGGQILMPDLFVANEDMYNRLKALGYLD